MITYLMAAFSLYRLSQLIAIDDGPLFIFARLRSWIDSKSVKEQKAKVERGKWQSFNDGIHCPYCVGLWLAIPVGILVYTGIVHELVWIILGLAGIQAFLQRFDGI